MKLKYIVHKAIYHRAYDYKNTDYKNILILWKPIIATIYCSSGQLTETIG